jgi:flagellar protein FlaG
MKMITSVASTPGAIAGSSAAPSVPRPASESPQAGQAPSSGASVGTENVKQIVEQMQGQLDSMNVSLQYSVYGNKDDKIAVKVVDRDTGKVIREIPAKEMQALQDKMSELVGMIFDHKT